MAHSYIGRFAPSPSGPLHFGSLLCAFASFLHARQHNGKWLVRIEDIDTPRIDSAMSKVILDSLHAHGLDWDEKVTYQSDRLDYYQSVLDKLSLQHDIYACACSRKQIKARSQFYDQHCRHLQLTFLDRAIRFKHDQTNNQFDDFILGSQNIEDGIANEDFVVKRADGIFAYHLVVVADDIEQQVSHILRGNDLLSMTPVHLSLFQAMQAHIPEYGHMPVVVQAPKQKLSKQHHSPAIDDSRALENIKLALCYLGIPIHKQANLTTVHSMVGWAIKNWHLEMLPKQTELLISITNGVYSMSDEPILNNNA
ncbi:tRNA glutamyl-Q(34) synthetase GluQRS [Glaciecola petra]|uniref:tRNA glutamyl-Q(34) synthetase GluQRS n=1 Tax=Glaciecola petra TaxID=3075602 RepID=A0ABU2ZVL8_9ALTE|nr:tRNA glutamyl-Q(34) synthetase GluQRS [Aestuariibacter sp. P117]MDT0595462.1 tRNA glutamyl-Q(34) synthetase GluQRS [Aestuariibacter sp. P117]